MLFFQMRVMGVGVVMVMMSGMGKRMICGRMVWYSKLCNNAEFFSCKSRRERIRYMSAKVFFRDVVRKSVRLQY